MESGESGREDLGQAPEGDAAGMARWLRGFGGEEATTRILSMCLATAANSGNASLARQLLEQGAISEMAERAVGGEDPNRLSFLDKDHGGPWNTPWAAAISADAVDCLEAMIESGMSAVKPRLLIGDAAERKEFLAALAASFGAERCFARLLDLAAKQAPKDFEEITSKSWAALVLGDNDEAGKVESIARSLQSAGSDINGNWARGFLYGAGVATTLLEANAASGRVGALAGLLAAGADPKVGLAVNFAAKSLLGGSAACLSLLLKAGADPNLRAQGESALFAAIQGCCAEKARMLIDAGARMDGAAPAGSGLLAEAAMRGSLSCVRLLLAKGVDPDERVDGVAIEEWAMEHRRKKYAPEPKDWAEALAAIKAASEAKALAAASPLAQKRSFGPRM